MSTTDDDDSRGDDHDNNGQVIEDSHLLNNNKLEVMIMTTTITLTFPSVSDIFVVLVSSGNNNRKGLTVISISGEIKGFLDLSW